MILPLPGCADKFDEVIDNSAKRYNTINRLGEKPKILDVMLVLNSMPALKDDWYSLIGQVSSGEIAQPDVSDAVRIVMDEGELSPA